MRVSDGGFPTTYYWYVVDKETMTDVYVNNVSMDCVVIDGTIMFGKMPTISMTGTTHNATSDTVTFTLSAPSLNWDIGSWTVKGEINDSTPDDNVGTMSADRTSISNYTISNAYSTYGSGTKTVYSRLYYNGVYSGTASKTVVLSAPPSNQWSWTSTESSLTLSYDVIVYAADWSSPGDASEALLALENLFPADNYSVGDVGVVESTADEYHYYEVT